MSAMAPSGTLNPISSPLYEWTKAERDHFIPDLWDSECPCYRGHASFVVVQIPPGEAIIKNESAGGKHPWVRRPKIGSKVKALGGNKFPPSAGGLGYGDSIYAVAGTTYEVNELGELVLRSEDDQRQHKTNQVMCGSWAVELSGDGSDTAVCVGLHWVAPHEGCDGIGSFVGGSV